MIKNFNVKRIIQGRLYKGDEIISRLSSFLKDNSITSGIITGIGAVSFAKIGYYNQTEQKYIAREFNEAMEILSLKGNISIKDNEPFMHLHIVLSKDDFTCIGGHLSEAKIFAFEFEIIEFEGISFERGFDSDTGLFLWKD
ncbi:MAG TPA: DNA-binding protein [Thermodesulfovibrio thiophilus]|uniref:PPC domain-containing DNA-binding protein n=1 Tax=Thermodesulfovibrio thiophilus TaxID=340095 RepID=UPI0018472507|nr:PPC domain-containing DNA-binding protein [Thermodesulfovibrio thiophilus]HHW19896.1 DNA-binding protein [Thermodesulfovibrio thiophilus]HQA03135.1 DNA-binding protein [Thermodesulfovibrio thiophilus]HQD35497.1 DNA-binding protein [Thermodesulfovibrio thiophilus]